MARRTLAEGVSPEYEAGCIPIRTVAQLASMDVANATVVKSATVGCNIWVE